ncbi:MAG: sensor histidine kinase [Faecousia sp.]
MKLLTIWGVFNYGLVLIYGLFLSVFIAGGWGNGNQRSLVIALCPVFILIQIPFWLLLGEDTVKKLYPLIVHLPLMLILIFALKKPVGVSIVSVLTAYLCCQLPRWGNIAVEAVMGSELAGEIVYTLLIAPLFFLLLRYFVKPAHSAMTYSRQSLLLFGSLPAVYYLFDYATTIYSDSLYAGIPALNELIPTALILFYLVFLAVYHHETQERTRAELQSSAQAALFRQAQKEMDALHQAQIQAAIYRHDMRHHLNVIDSFLATGQPEQALAYIRKTREDMTSISVKRFCENETVNLICSSFADKAARMGVRLTVSAQLPEVLSVSDTELCAILSNGLENALNAVAHLDDAAKWIKLYCGVKRSQLLIGIKNPYAGSIAMEDGLPVTSEAGHGYGCRSIRAIVLQHGGLYTFTPENGIFTLQIALPLFPM